MAAESSRVKSIYLRAAELSDPQTRRGFLDQECGHDAELRARVESLLRAEDSSPLAIPGSELGTEGASLAEKSSGDPSLVTTREYRLRYESGVLISNRYILQEKIGEGGMGEVWVAKQTEPVKRRVALKLNKPGMDSCTVLARFEQERQALALMDHPNIARVLDAGLTPTGQPFFVMELVNGLALNKFCDELKLTPRERLELFVPICQAVQHAHQKGIVHRDLKPANILITMIDGKPVPKVIDFGVAKATAGKLSDDSIATQFGSVVGTLEYMSPEQAGFSGEDIDTRSDIYSLGVILYEMLTGLKPIDAARVKKAALTEMIRIIREEDPSRPSTRLSTNESLPSLAALRRTEPRKLMSMLKGDLDWVVMKCLEKQRERRYETANGLAREIQRYLADEMVEARPPCTRYRMGKFLRRYPLQLSLAGALTLLVLGGAGVVWWQQEQAGSRREAELRQQLEEEQRAATEVARNARNAEAVASLLGQCEEALRSDDSKRAVLVLEAAKKRFAEGGAEELAEKLSNLETDLALLMGLAEADRFRWVPLEGKNPDKEGIALKYARILKEFGMEPDSTDPETVVRKAAVSVIRERVISALDLHLRFGKSRATLGTLKRLDPDPFRDAVREAIWAQDSKRIAELAQKKEAEEQPSWFTAYLGQSSAVPLERRPQLFQKALLDRPGNLGLLMAMGQSYPLNVKDGASERLRWYQAAVAAAPDNSAGFNNLGLAFRDLGQHLEAQAAFQKAMEIDRKYAESHMYMGATLYDKGQLDATIASFRKAIELNPRLAAAHSFLGKAFREKGQLEDAIASCQKAIELEPKLASAHTNLGLALKEKGQLDAAVASCQKAIELDPNSFDAYGNLGMVLRDKGQLDAAIASCQKAILLNPKSAFAHHALGSALEKKGQIDLAIASLQKSIELDPKQSNGHYNLGLTLVEKGELDAAIACFEKAIELNPKMASSHDSLGRVLEKKGQLDAAIAKYRKALEFDPKLALAYSHLGAALQKRKGTDGEVMACFQKAIELKPGNAGFHNNFGLALKEKGQLDAAIASFQKAIELDPSLSAPHYNLGNALKKQGLLDAAIESYQKAIKADPQNAGAHNNLGFSLKENGKLDQAIMSFQKVIELDQQIANANKSTAGLPFSENQMNEKFDHSRKSVVAQSNYNLGLLFLDMDQVDKAIPHYQKALELNPQYADAHNGLGSSLMKKKQWDAAIASYHKAIELKPLDPKYHYNLGLAFSNKKFWDTAIKCLQKAIELDPKFGSAHMQLGIAFKEKDQVDKAIASYQKAIDLDPKLDLAYANLGNALQLKNQWKEAIASYQKAIDLNLKDPVVYSNLGVALKEIGQLDEAIANYQKAINLDKKLVKTYINLGVVQNRKKQTDEALDSFKKAIELDPNNGNIHVAVGLTLMETMRTDEAIVYFQKALTINPGDTNAKTSLASAKRLSIGLGKIISYLKGEYTPQTNEDRLALIEVCQRQKHYHAGAELFAAAFASDPKLAEDVNNFNRYNAACCAALASTGMGTDSAKLDESERSHLRRQALDWLKADLAAYQTMLTHGTLAQKALAVKRLTHWQTDPDLASTRDKAPLSKLPPEESKAFTQLWGEVASTLEKAKNLPK